MKRLLSIALVSCLAALSVSAQATSTERGLGIRPSDVGRRAPPVNNPEPVTLIALAGGAAVAGGLLRRRNKAS